MPEQPGITYLVIKATPPWKLNTLFAIWRMLDTAARRLGNVVICETQVDDGASDIICVRDLGERTK